VEDMQVFRSVQAYAAGQRRDDLCMTRSTGLGTGGLSSTGNKSL
jgi:hypothetical protein